MPELTHIVTDHIEPPEPPVDMRVLYSTFRVKVDTSAIEPGLTRIREAFERKRLTQWQTARLLKAMKRGTELVDSADFSTVYVCWREGVECVIDEVLGMDDGSANMDRVDT